jgi:hypothetical protein
MARHSLRRVDLNQQIGVRGGLGSRGIHGIRGLRGVGRVRRVLCGLP